MNENIEISMDNIIAYSVLKQASFPHDQYPETWNLIALFKISADLSPEYQILYSRNDIHHYHIGKR